MKKFPSILDKLFPWDKTSACGKIMEVYAQKAYTIIDFLYFANTVFNWLDQDTRTNRQERYVSSLENADILLPDGIAIELLYKKYFGKKLSNLNGTDFLPYFLSYLKTKQKVSVILYWERTSVWEEAKKYIENTLKHPVIFHNDGFKEFDWNALEDILETREKNETQVLLVGRWTPLQEIWIEENRDKIEEHKLITFGIGGLLSFWAGTEKRAPEWIRKIRWEWLYRAITQPRKNLKKTLVSLKLFWYLLGK